jgi:hypothetical protein
MRVRWFSFRLALLIVLFALPLIVISASVFWISSVWLAGSDLGVCIPFGFGDSLFSCCVVVSGCWGRRIA